MRKSLLTLTVILSPWSALRQIPAAFPPTPPGIPRGNLTATAGQPPPTNFNAIGNTKSGHPWYDVWEFGAVGDDRTDDWRSIQNAINRAGTGTMEDGGICNGNVIGVVNGTGRPHIGIAASTTNTIFTANRVVDSARGDGQEGIHLGNCSACSQVATNGTSLGNIVAYNRVTHFSKTYVVPNAGDLLISDDGSGNPQVNHSVSIGSRTADASLDVNPGGTTLADAWTTRSSARLKTNIHPLAGAVGIIAKLRGVSYDWRANGKHDVGLIAEEVAQVVPEVVSFDSTGQPEGLDYAGLTALLIEAVKQQQIIAKQQQTEVRNLRSEVRRLNARLNGAGNVNYCSVVASAAKPSRARRP